MRTAALIVSRVPGLSSTMRMVPGSFIGNISRWTVAPSRILLETTLTALFVHIRRRKRSLTNGRGPVQARDGTAVESPRETYFDPAGRAARGFRRFSVAVRTRKGKGTLGNALWKSLVRRRARVRVDYGFEICFCFRRFLVTTVGLSR